MNYKLIYAKIIHHRKNNPLTKETYGEVHHIIPRALGGLDDKSNLVKLSYREHFVCHELLLKFIPNNTKAYNKMLCAYNMMCDMKAKRSLKINSKLYEKWRKEFCIRIGQLNSQKQIGIKNSQFGKMWVTNGIENLKIDKKENIPEGWKAGRMSTIIRITDGITCKSISNKNDIPIGWYIKVPIEYLNINDGIKNKKILKTETIPEGWIEGKIKTKNTKHKIWITNGTESKCILKTETIPDGWKKGRINSYTAIWITNGIVCRQMSDKAQIPEGWYLGTVTKFINITNGIENKLVLRVDGIPDGWIEGKTVLPKVKKSRKTKGTTWMNDGVNNKRIPLDYPIPEGWVQGKTKYKKIWINDGIENKYMNIDEDIPDGWRKGFISKTKFGLMMVK
jgi:hypothetical protein